MRKFDAAAREMKAEFPDKEKFVKLMKEASDSGDHRAEYALATWYLFGTHLEQSHELALDLLHRAAAKGNSDALFDLAIAYELGHGVKKDEMQAFAYFVSSAIKGDKQAHFEVGRMIYFGLGTVKNPKSADFWLQKAERYGISMDNDFGVMPDIAPKFEQPS